MARGRRYYKVLDVIRKEPETLHYGRLTYDDAFFFLVFDDKNTRYNMTLLEFDIMTSDIEEGSIPEGPWNLVRRVRKIIKDRNRIKNPRTAQMEVDHGLPPVATPTDVDEGADIEIDPVADAQAQVADAIAQIREKLGPDTAIEINITVRGTV